jgi:hypothetical protein
MVHGGDRLLHAFCFAGKLVGRAQQGLSGPGRGTHFFGDRRGLLLIRRKCLDGEEKVVQPLRKLIDLIALMRELFVTANRLIAKARNRSREGQAKANCNQLKGKHGEKPSADKGRRRLMAISMD